MPVIYKLFTAIVAFIGNISLILTGQMQPIFSLFGAGLFWGYYRAMRDRKMLPKRVVGLLSLAVLFTFLLDARYSGDTFLAVAQMTLLFQTLKSFDIKEPWDPIQVFFVSLLQLLTASELTNSISFGVIFLFFLICIVISILASHLVKEGQSVFRPYLRPMASITVITLVLTAFFFVSVPRVRTGLWGKSFLEGIKTTGFSERVDFGSFGRVKRDETVVMRVIVNPDINGTLYMRGMTFDYFDNIAWHETKRERLRVRMSDLKNGKRPSSHERKFEAEIYLEPIDADVIFTVGRPYRIDATGYYMRMDRAGSFYMKQKIAKRFFYRVFAIDAPPDDNKYLMSYLQIPQEMRSLQYLAQRITDEASDESEKARNIRNYLVNNFEYSLYTEPPDDGSSEIEHFLLTSRKGYCEHFATAMTIMLRSVGIPSRFVTGYATSRKSDYGDYYLIRQSDAHSWVEAFINDRWERYDPTPIGSTSMEIGFRQFLDLLNLNWYRYVIGFSSYDQVQIGKHLLTLRMPAFPFPGNAAYIAYIGSVALIGLVILIFAKRALRKGSAYGKYSGVSSEYSKFRKKVLRFGGKISPASSSEDVMREALGTGRFNALQTEKFIDVYRFLRFSGRSDKERISDFYRLSKVLMKKKTSRNKAN